MQEGFKLLLPTPKIDSKSPMTEDFMRKNLLSKL